MSERAIFYDGEQLRLFDLLKSEQDWVFALGLAIGDILGQAPPIVAGFSASASSPPNMSVTIGPGRIYFYAPLDATPYGDLPADSRNSYQQGVAIANTVLNITTGGLGSGQEQQVLIEATYQQVDNIRAGDPDGGIPPFFNPGDLLTPLQGENGDEETLPTCRQNLAIVQPVYGIPAAIGSSTTPAPSLNSVPLFVITINNTTATIPQGSIVAASGVPILAGLLNAHHGGGTGQAPPIDLTREVQNILGLAHLPVSNASPPAAGGSITMGGIISVTYGGTVVPTGNVAGNARDFYIENASGTYTLWVCAVTGTASTAVWEQFSPPTTPPAIDVANKVTTSPFTPQPGYINQCDPAAGASVIDLDFAANMNGLPVTIVHTGAIGSAQITINPKSGERINNQANGVGMPLDPGDSIRFTPASTVGYFETM